MEGSAEGSRPLTPDDSCTRTAVRKSGLPIGQSLAIGAASRQTEETAKSETALTVLPLSTGIDLCCVIRLRS